MKVSETTYTVNKFGNLHIPKTVLQRMGLHAGNHVRVAYITDDDEKNVYCEFLLSADSIDAVESSEQISVPTKLMRQAKLAENVDIQVICVNGAIVLCSDDALTSEELQIVLDGLDSTVRITEQLSTDPNKALYALRGSTDAMKGANDGNEERKNDCSTGNSGEADLCSC